MKKNIIEHICDGCNKVNYYNANVESKPKWCHFCLKVFYWTVRVVIISHANTSTKMSWLPKENDVWSIVVSKRQKHPSLLVYILFTYYHRKAIQGKRCSIISKTICFSRTFTMRKLWKILHEKQWWQKTDVIQLC